jgi:hypothetical protein
VGSGYIIGFRVDSIFWQAGVCLSLTVNIKNKRQEQSKNVYVFHNLFLINKNFKNLKDFVAFGIFQHPPLLGMA